MFYSSPTVRSFLENLPSSGVESRDRLRVLNPHLHMLPASDGTSPLILIPAVDEGLQQRAPSCWLCAVVTLGLCARATAAREDSFQAFE